MIQKSTEIFEVLDWDTNHFGFKIGRAEITKTSHIAYSIMQAKHNKVKLLIMDCGFDDFSLVDLIEDSGARLTGVMVIYALDLSKPLPKRRTDFLIESTRVYKKQGQVLINEAVSALGKLTFTTTPNHYWNDPEITRERCNAFYEQWVRNSCFDKTVADDVYIALSQYREKVIGFGTIKILDGETGRIVLAGVLPEYRKQGVMHDLMVVRCERLRELGLKTVIGTTYVNIIPTQKCYASIGFKLQNTSMVFHKWLS